LIMARNCKLFSGGGTYGSMRDVFVEKICKISGTTRAQSFECYCREFETDMGVSWKPM